jgi:hypothetical protein
LLFFHGGVCALAAGNAMSVIAIVSAKVAVITVAVLFFIIFSPLI